MTFTNSPVFTQAPATQHLLLVPAHATRYRPIWRPDLDDPLAAPNGAKIKKIMVASTDAANNELQLAIGKPVTIVADMGTATFVDGGGSSDTIIRTAGSFVTDGWQVGHRIQILGATTLANDFDALLTGVAATTLTFATGTVSTGEVFPAGAMILRMNMLWRKQILATAGSAVAVVAVSMLDPTTQPAFDAAPDRYLYPGPDDYLFAKVTTAMGSGETMDIVTEARVF